MYLYLAMLLIKNRLLHVSQYFVTLGGMAGIILKIKDYFCCKHDPREYKYRVLAILFKLNVI